MVSIVNNGARVRVTMTGVQGPAYPSEAVQTASETARDTALGYRDEAEGFRNEAEDFSDNASGYATLRLLRQPMRGLLRLTH